MRSPSVCLPYRPLYSSTVGGRGFCAVLLTLLSTMHSYADTPVVYMSNPSAGTGSFATVPSTVKYGDTLTVHIEDVNTFRFKYSVISKSLNTTSVAQPNAIYTLFTVLSNKTNSDAGSSTVRKALSEQMAQYAVELSKSQPTVALDPIVTRAENVATKYAEKYDRYNDTMKPVKTLAAGVSNSIERDTTNAEIRAKCRSVVATFLGLPDTTLGDVLQIKLESYNLTQLSANVATANNYYGLWGKIFDDPTLSPAERDALAPIDSLIQMSESDINLYGANALKLLQSTVDAFAQVNNPIASPDELIYHIKTGPGIALSDEVLLEIDTEYVPISLIALDGSGVQIATLKPQLPINRDMSAIRLIDRWVIQLTAGGFMTGLRSKNYYGQPVVDAAGHPVNNLFGKQLLRVTEGNSDSQDISFGGLATFYRTSANNFTFGPCLGVSGNKDPRYLAGLSIVYAAHRSRVLLSGGESYGRVPRLANGDSVGIISNTGTITTNSVVRNSWFAGLTLSMGL